MIKPIKDLPVIKPLFARRTYLSCSLLVFFVVAILHFAFMPLEIQGVSKLPKFFSFRHELNLPTFLSSLNLYIGSFLAFSLFRSSSKHFEKRFWIIISIILSVMGYDEAAGLHEYYGSKYFSAYTFEFLKIKPVWLNSYIPIVIVSGTLLLFDFCRLRNTSRASILLPCFLFLLGSVGLEALNFELKLTNGLSGAILETVEELLEILAIIWLNASFITALDRRLARVVIASSADK